jgi:hypothetical protein
MGEAMPPVGVPEIAALGGFISALVAGFWAWMTQRTSATERLQVTTFEQAQATIKNQGESILRLEGRLDQLGVQVGTLLADNAVLVAKNIRLESDLAAARSVIASHELEIGSLQRRLGENQ